MGKLVYEKISEGEKIQFLKKTIKILENNNIDYWFDFGTLLGCIRDGKFIEWDSDIDLFVWDLEDIKKIEKQFNLNKLFFIEKNTQYQNKVLVVSPDLEYFPISISTLEKVNDFFYYKFITRTNIISRISNTFIFVFKGDIYKLGNTSPNTMKKLVRFAQIFPFRSHITNILIDLEYFFSRKSAFIYKPFKTIKTKFYDMDVRIPEDYEKHLIYTYGDTWKIPDKNFKDYNKYSKKINGVYITKFWDYMNKGEKKYEY